MSAMAVVAATLEPRGKRYCFFEAVCLRETCKSLIGVLVLSHIEEPRAGMVASFYAETRPKHDCQSFLTVYALAEL